MFDTESEIQQLVQIEGPKWGCKLERNNSGAFEDKTGRHVRFGLGNVSKKHSDQMKSADLVGFKQIVVTPEMVGKTIAVITGIEMKTPGWKFNPKDAHERAQFNWLQWISNHGGFAGFAQSVDDFKRIIGVLR
jgi:hypothetical protein